ncbi:hypothetical protein [Pectobacterium brasiliense]|uniref:hypothetical protein n=1 Tax=Pectobacterium brasiliense TaxID=180957 RepID=UPI0030CA249A
MAINDVVKCTEKRIKTLAVGKGHHAAEQISIALFLQEMVEENTFLQRCERIDVLYIARTTRHCISYPIDLGWVSVTIGSRSGVMAVQSTGMRLGGTTTQSAYPDAPLSPAPCH